MGTLEKPIKDWTLGEVKAYCAATQCIECMLWRDGGCRYIDGIPSSWDLTEVPNWTEAERGAIRIMRLMGCTTVEREKDGTVWFTLYGNQETRTRMGGKLLPSLAPGQKVEL